MTKYSAYDDGLAYGREQANRGLREPTDFGEYRNLWVDGYLAGFEQQRTRLLSPYGERCLRPDLCAGKGYCPRDPSCGD